MVGFINMDSIFRIHIFTLVLFFSKKKKDYKLTKFPPITKDINVST